MYCPEHLAFCIQRKTWNFYVWMYWRDVRKVPFHIWLNPLRYQFSVCLHTKGKFYVINREGVLAYRWSNFVWKLIHRKKS